MGSGGYGDVYLAESLLLGDPYKFQALKFPKTY